MARLFLTLFVIIYISAFLSLTLNKKIGSTIPMTYVVMALLMLLTSIVFKISMFKYVVLVIIFIVTILIVFKFHKKKVTSHEVKQLCLKPSLIIYTLFFCYLYFVLRNVQLSNIDDLGLWGTRILDMNRTDALYTNEYTVFGNSAYPPFTAMLSLVFIKLFGTIKQSYMIFAQASFSFSIFVSLLDNYDFNYKNCLKVLSILLIIICATLMVHTNYSFGDHAFIYNSIYVDWILGILLAKGLFLLYCFDIDKIANYIEIGLYGVALALTKQTGLPLALIPMAGTYCVIALKTNRLLISNIYMKKYLLYVIGIPAIFYVIWKTYYSIFTGNYLLLNYKLILCIIIFAMLLLMSAFVVYKLYINKKNRINFRVLFIITLIFPLILYLISNVIVNTSINNNYKVNIIIRFVIACFNTPIIIKTIKLSYYPITILVTITLFLIFKRRNNDASAYTIPVLYYLGSIAYALVILLSYLFVFGHEGYSLVVFGRYMQTYTYAGICLVIIIFLMKKLNLYKILVCLLVSILLVETKSINTLIYNPNWQNYRNEAQIKALSDYFEYEYKYESMAVFAQNDMRDLNLIGYIADEKKVNIEYYPTLEKNQYERFMTAVSENEYIFVANRDDNLIKLWKKISDEEPYNMSIYRVEYRNGRYSVVLIKTLDDVK